MDRRADAVSVTKEVDDYLMHNNYNHSLFFDCGAVKSSLENLQEVIFQNVVNILLQFQERTVLQCQE